MHGATDTTCPRIILLVIVVVIVTVVVIDRDIEGLRTHLSDRCTTRLDGNVEQPLLVILLGHLALVLVHPSSSSLGFALVKPDLGHVLSCTTSG